MKLVDVLSYVGGILPPLFAVFFIVNYFGMYFFEMEFAKRHFGNLDAKKRSFFTYFKYLAYKGLSFC